MTVCELCCCVQEEDNEIVYDGVMWLCQECIKELNRQRDIAEGSFINGYT